MRWAFFTLAALILAGCTGSEGASLDQVDCSACGADEVCWYDLDLEADAYRTHCAPWPTYCADDKSCACLDTQRDADDRAFCDAFGVQNSNACEVRDARPVIYCETNLG